MSSANRQFERILTGLVVSYVVVAIAIGDLMAAGTLIIASIVCTLGVSFLMWLPLWWLVGWIVLAVVGLIRAGINHLPEAQFHSTQPAVRDSIALSRYVHRSRVAGASDTQITHRLREQGWTEAEITDALNSFSTEQDDR